MNITDALGISFVIGDTVLVSSWGGTVRLYDTGRRATVTGITARGKVEVAALDMDEPIANGRAVRPDCLTILRRDGEAGLEGNR